MPETPNKPEFQGPQQSSLEQSDQQEIIRALEEEHQRVNTEWRDLMEEEARLLAEGGTALDRLTTIHDRRLAIVDRLWQIEQKIMAARRDAEHQE